MRQWPIGVERLERKADRIHQLVAALAGGLVGDAGRACSRIDGTFALPAASPVFATSAGTFGGGSGAGTPSMFFSTHWPRITGDVRPGCEDTVSTAPLPSKPQRAFWLLSSVTRLELAAANAGNAVVLRQSLVHERVVGGEQIENAAIFGRAGCANSSSASRRKAWRRLSSKSGN